MAEEKSRVILICDSDAARVRTTHRKRFVPTETALRFRGKSLDIRNVVLAANECINQSISQALLLESQIIFVYQLRRLRLGHKEVNPLLPITVVASI
jgi:hypothetical protein